MSSASDRPQFQREVADRFGLAPNFFSSSPDAPEIIERLWDFAKAAYLDNPMPSLFKERLFVYLSRFCEVRYCIVRHCAFLVGRGHASGDTSVVVQTVEHAIRLLKTPSPWARDLDVVLGGLEALPAIKEWSAPDTEAEDGRIAATTLVFVEPARSERPRNALRKVLGGNQFEHLLGLLAFIRTAHYWTVLHPELTADIAPASPAKGRRFDRAVIQLVGLNQLTSSGQRWMSTLNVDIDDAAMRSDKWRTFRGLRKRWRQSPWRPVVLLHYLAAACWNSPSDYF